MAYITVLAVIEIPDGELARKGDDELTDTAWELFIDQGKVHFVCAELDVSAQAVAAGADPSILRRA